MILGHGTSLVMVARHQDLDRVGLVGDCVQKMAVKSIGGHRSRQGDSWNVQLVKQLLVHYAPHNKHNSHITEKNTNSGH